MQRCLQPLCLPTSRGHQSDSGDRVFCLSVLQEAAIEALDDIKMGQAARDKQAKRDWSDMEVFQREVRAHMQETTDTQNRILAVVSSRDHSLSIPPNPPLGMPPTQRLAPQPQGALDQVSKSSICEPMTLSSLHLLHCHRPFGAQLHEWLWVLARAWASSI